MPPKIMNFRTLETVKRSEMQVLSLIDPETVDGQRDHLKMKHIQQHGGQVKGLKDHPQWDDQKIKDIRTA